MESNEPPTLQEQTQEQEPQEDIIESEDENINEINETLFGIPPGVVMKIIQKYVDLKNYKLRKEAVQTLTRCLSVFILYITNGALEHSENEKRSTIYLRDILGALDESLFLDIAEEVKRQVTADEEEHANNIKRDTQNNQTEVSNIMETNTENKQKEEQADDLDLLLEAL